MIYLQYHDYTWNLLLCPTLYALRIVLLMKSAPTLLRVTIGTRVFWGSASWMKMIIIMNFSTYYVLNFEYPINEHKSTERNFPQLRFFNLYGLKLSGPESWHFPTNHLNNTYSPGWVQPQIRTRYSGIFFIPVINYISERVFFHSEGMCSDCK